MNPDELKDAWKGQTSQTRPTIDAELLLKEVQRSHRHLTAMIFWRDVREVVASVLLVPLWLYLGLANSSPWTWYLMVPALVWIAGYMLAYRIRHGRQQPERDEPLRRRVAGSLGQVERQIRLLRDVVLWALLPLSLAMLAFLGQVAWEERSGGWWTVLAISGVVGLAGIVLAGVYLLNQHAVRSELEPRRRELATLLMSLEDEGPVAN